MTEVLEWKNPDDDDSELMKKLRTRPGEWALIRKNMSGRAWNFTLTDLELVNLRADDRFELEIKQPNSIFTCDVYARYIPDDNHV